jgi:hypothetical protein
VKKIATLALVTAFTAQACNTTKQRDTEGQVQSTAVVPTAAQAAQFKLNGSRLGQGKSRNIGKGLNTAYRFYVNEAKDEPGTYNVLLFEYANIPTILPQYLAARKAPILNNVIGYLNHIGDNVQIYKMRPSSDPKVFNLYTLKVNGTSISVNDGQPIMTLNLSEHGKAEDPLAGARLNPTEAGGFEVYFPFEGDGKLHAPQYALAATTYKLAKLDSTWRKHFLPGPFLAAYGKVDDVALQLTAKDGVSSALFINNAAKFPRENREKIFTSPKSAFLEGSYTVSSPDDGIFLLSPDKPGQRDAEQLEGRIGLYIDVFDATVSRNEDVVELFFVNPSDPSDFFMYCEHPENGDGKSGT